MQDIEFPLLIWWVLYVPVLSHMIACKIWIYKGFIFSIFYFYVVGVIAVTLFPFPFENRLYESGMNFIPFSSIIEIFSNSNINFWNKFRQLVWNIILFLPLWFLVSLTSRKKSFIKILGISFLCSCMIEFIQWFIWFCIDFNYRVIDIDDIILNTLWWATGYLLREIKINTKLIKK